MRLLSPLSEGHKSKPTYFNAESVVVARVAIQKDVAGLKIAMDDAFFVQHLHSSHNLLEKRTDLCTDRFYNRKWPK